MAKFQKGEVAVFARTDNPEHRHFIGQEVEILDHMYLPGHGDSYQLSLDNGDIYCKEWVLRKKRPPEESDDIRETREKGAPSFSKMMKDLNVEVV